MAAPTRFTNECEFSQPCTFVGAVSLPSGTVTNANIATAAGIVASKLVSRRSIGYGQPNSAATTETRVVFACYGTTATVLQFAAGSIAKAVGDSTVTIDLKKNGSSILSAVITLDSGNTNRLLETATLSSTALVAGDWLEIVITATVGTGTLPTGVFVRLLLDEDPA